MDCAAAMACDGARVLSSLKETGGQGALSAGALSILEGTLQEEHPLATDSARLVQ
jgi:hypothetical protein